MRRRPSTLVTSVVALALLAACGSSGGGVGSSSPDASAPGTAGRASAAPGSTTSAEASAAPGSATASPSGDHASAPAAAPAAAAPRAATGEPVTISFGGDVHFMGSSRSALSGGLAAITPALSAADVTVVNLETSITTGGTPAPGKQYVFRAPPAGMTALRRAGVDVATMANNHGLDYGQQGLTDSLAASRSTGLPVIGIGTDADQAFAPWRTTVKGQRIAVIGATQVLDSSLASAWTSGPGKPGLASAKDVPRLVEAVRQARATSDTVVVDLHWGKELSTCPVPQQESLATTLVAAGADVIVGSHAHVLLGGGYLDGAYVDYGLGNFVFYARSGAGTETGVLTLTVQGRKVTSSKWVPARISGGVPRPLSGAAAEQAVANKDRLRSCTTLSATP